MPTVPGRRVRYPRIVSWTCQTHESDPSSDPDQATPTNFTPAGAYLQAVALRCGTVARCPNVAGLLPLPRAKPPWADCAKQSLFVGIAHSDRRAAKGTVTRVPLASNKSPNRKSAPRDLMRVTVEPDVQKMPLCDSKDVAALRETLKTWRGDPPGTLEGWSAPAASGLLRERSAKRRRRVGRSRAASSSGTTRGTIQPRRTTRTCWGSTR